MKILIIIPNISHSGGTERAAVNLANMLEKSFYNVIILSLNSNVKDKSYYALTDSIKVVHTGISPIPVGIIDKLNWYPKSISTLKKEIKEINPDLIFGEGHNINCMLPFIRQNKKIPVIGCEHIVFMSIPLFSRALMKLVYRHLNGLVVLSANAKVAISGLNKNINVIPNTLPFLPEDSSSLDAKRLLLVGRLSIEKGYERLVPIAKVLKIKYPLWRIEIFGEGEQKAHLLELYKREKVEDYITINSPVKDIKNEYLKSSIYIMTSHSEAMPMVLLEAKSCGLPVIGYRCEGTAELIHNSVDGFLIDDNDSASFIDKISILIEDVTLRNEMGSNAKTSAFKYAPDNIINSWTLLIEELVSKMEKRIDNA